jgi:hypothetical protein
MMDKVQNHDPFKWNTTLSELKQQGYMFTNRCKGLRPILLTHSMIDEYGSDGGGTCSNGGVNDDGGESSIIEVKSTA